MDTMDIGEFEEIVRDMLYEYDEDFDGDFHYEFVNVVAFLLKDTDRAKVVNAIKKYKETYQPPKENYAWT
jgi:hypothetical protein